MQEKLQKIEQVLSDRVEQVLPSKAELKKLMSKKKIRLYLGVDPTGNRLHLGHTIPLRKIQEFADLGHEAILVIGTGTVLAGDPSQRDSSRELISERKIKDNIRTWKNQAGKIVNFSKVKIKYNGDWLLKLGLKDIVKIASNISAVKLIQRDMFQRRISSGSTVWMHEVLYPLLQGYDSVFLDVDLEVGGNDQVFNMLIGRELQQKIKKREKFVLTGPMILGTDGKIMSKSSGNCVWLSDSPKNKFGKIMSIPDNLIISYFQLLTDTPALKIKEYKEKMDKGQVNPRDLKKNLAFEIVKMYDSPALAEKSKKEFEAVFEKKELPSVIPTIKIEGKEIGILDLLVKIKLSSSKAEAKRLVLQKGVKIEGKVFNDWREAVKIKKGLIVQVGKRKFAKLG
ncbi:MAG: tyrosine--tRNA ligase [Candidatus Nealsonbacteria bacterium]